MIAPCTRLLALFLIAFPCLGAAQDAARWRERLAAGEAEAVLGEIEQIALGSDPDREALLVGAEAALALESAGRARSLADQCLTRTPRSDRAALLLGHALMLQARQDQERGARLIGKAAAASAAEAFQRAREYGADSWAASWFEAEAWLATQDLGRALEALEAALASRPRDAGTWDFRARVLLLRAASTGRVDFEAAREAADRAAEEDHGLASAFARGLEARIRLLDRAAVRAHFQAAVAQHPSEVRLYQIVQESYGDDRPPEFLTQLLADAVATVPPERAGTALWFAAAHARAKLEWAESEIWIRRYLELVPRDPGGVFFLGLSLYKLGRLKPSEVAWLDSLALGYDEEEVLKALRFVVGAYAAERRFAEAAGLQREVLLRSGAAADRAGLGVLLVNSGDRPGGIKLYREVVQSASTSALVRARVWNDLGLALLGTGQREDALAAFQESLALDPTGLDARENLGIAHLELGQSAAASQAFEAVLAADGTRHRSRYMWLRAKDGLLAPPRRL